MPLTEGDLMQYLSQRQGLDLDQLDRGTVLFSDGLLDSFRMVEVITFVESKVGIRMTPSEITLDNLDSVQRILAFVASRASN